MLDGAEIGSGRLGGRRRGWLTGALRGRRRRAACGEEPAPTPAPPASRVRREIDGASDASDTCHSSANLAFSHPTGQSVRWSGVSQAAIHVDGRLRLQHAANVLVQVYEMKAAECPEPAGVAALHSPPVIEWRGDALVVLDQTACPARSGCWSCGRQPRWSMPSAASPFAGAPLIGVCGAFGVVLGLRGGEPLERLVDQVGGARPTAVNLRWAVDQVAVAARHSADPLVAAEAEAVRLLEADQESCRQIGAAGLVELDGLSRVLTHCNAGRLATCGMGSALAPVYAKAAAGQQVSVFATETRPLQQGARLTAWELSVAGIPVTLVPDTAAGAVLVVRTRRWRHRGLRPGGRERRYRQQNRHLFTRGTGARERSAVLRHRAAVDVRQRDAQRCADRHRGTPGLRGARPRRRHHRPGRSGVEPGVRHHPGRIHQRVHHRRRRAAAAVRRVHRRARSEAADAAGSRTSSGG